MDYSPPGSSDGEFSRQEYWNVSPCPPPGNLPRPRMEHVVLRSTCIGKNVLYSSATCETHIVPNSLNNEGPLRESLKFVDKGLSLDADIA